MAIAAATDANDGPVLTVISKRLRSLRKKLNRINQMEESLSQGKALNKEQEEVLRSKASVVVAIDELEKLRPQLSSAVQEEVQQFVAKADTPAEKPKPNEDSFGDLLNVLYFGSLFAVSSQSDYTSTMLRRTHERGCCLTYDYVTDDDSADLLGEKDLDLISMLSGLLTSRPVDSSLSHRNALQQCVEHAKMWLANADHPIDPNSTVTYAALRERLNRIMASDYFTTTPEMKASVAVAAAAAAGSYVAVQVPVEGTLEPEAIPPHIEGSAIEQHEHEDETPPEYQEKENGVQPSPTEELKQDESFHDNPSESLDQQETANSHTEEAEFNQREREWKDQKYASRRNYNGQRGGRGGGRGGHRGGGYYSNSRGGSRNGGRGGGPNQNGSYYDNSGDYQPRHYNNSRGRGGGGRGGGYSYNHQNHGGAARGGHAGADNGVAS